MISESDVLMSEGRAPLLSTAHLVSADATIPLDDGHYDTPQELSSGVTYTGDVQAHRLCGRGCLSCERGSYVGTFAANTLQGDGSFNTHPHHSDDSPRSTDDTMAPSELQRTPSRPFGGSTTTASLTGLAEQGLDPTTVVSYEGEWRDGVPCGRGCMRWENGDAYEGLFDLGQPHGSGTADAPNTFTFADGRVYTGEFDHGLLDGKGKLTHPNGDFYDGQFVRGTVTGFGTVVYAKGPRLYRGLFEHGRKVKGYLRFPGSQRGYEGEWQDDVPHGAGSMTFANGDFYKGDFSSGELQGVGCLCYQKPVGKIYYGQFLHGQPCGRGFLYEPEGVQSDDSESEPSEAKVTEGYFQNGQALAEDDADVREAVVEATRGLRMPEASAPPYTTLLQQRPASAAAALTASFGGFSFSTMPHTERMGTPPTFNSSFVPGIPLYPSSRQAGTSGKLLSPAATTAPSLSLGMSGGSLSLPSTNLVNNSFARNAQSSVNNPPPPPPPRSDGTGATEEVDDDEEAIVSVSSADVDEAEADNAVLIGAAGREDSTNSVMPFMNPAAGQDGSCRGWLEKCAIGRSNLSLISNWKKRYFILALCNDSVCLGYYEDELCHKPIGFIRLNTTDTRIVTCPTTKTHKKASRPGRDLCVIYHENRKEYKLLLRARDTEDHDRWTAAFRSFFLIVDRPSDYPMHAFNS